MPALAPTTPPAAASAWPPARSRWWARRSRTTVTRNDGGFDGGGGTDDTLFVDDNETVDWVYVPIRGDEQPEPWEVAVAICGVDEEARHFGVRMGGFWARGVGSIANDD